MLFSCDGDEYDAAGELELAENTRGFNGDGYSAGVVVGAGGGVVSVEVVRVARVVVAGDEDAAIGLGGVGSVQDSVDVGELGGLEDARGGAGLGWLDEVVTLDFEAAAAVGGDAFELGFDPVGRGAYASAWGQVGLHAGEGATVVEGDEFFDGGTDVVGGDLLECGGDGGVFRCGSDWRLGVEAAGEECGKRKATEAAGIISQDHRPLWKPNHCKNRRLDVLVAWPLKK